MCPSATTSEVGGALNGSVRMKLLRRLPTARRRRVVAADARDGRHAADDAVGADAVAHDAAARLIAAGDVPGRRPWRRRLLGARRAARHPRPQPQRDDAPDAGAGRRRFSLGRRSMPHSGSAPDIASMDDASSSADSGAAAAPAERALGPPLPGEEAEQPNFLAARARGGAGPGGVDQLAATKRVAADRRRAAQFGPLSAGAAPGRRWREVHRLSAHRDGAGGGPR